MDHDEDDYLMRTPPKPSRKDTKRKYTAEEKRQLLANLDIEVAHRTRQFETSLADILESFRDHHEGQVLRVPKLVRSMTMGDFADKYNGDMNEAMKGLHKDRAGGEPVPIDASARKRKWEESEAESSRAGKNARLQASPAKAGPSNPRISRVVKTPGASRPNRFHHSQANSPSPSKFVPTRPISPSKLPPGSRPPTSMSFNPYLPKTPGLPRPPRRNESMMSINGSPLEIPHQNGYLGGSIEEEDEEDGEEDSQEDQRRRLGKRTTIIVRRDPSFSFHSQNGRHPPSRTSSQTNGFMPSSQKSNSSTQSSSQPSSSQSTQPASQSQKFPSHTRSKSQLSAVVRVPTRDGHLLEFDPLLTSPEEIDGLEGITDTAKKQAKDDIARLVQTALAKWTI